MGQGSGPSGSIATAGSRGSSGTWTPPLIVLPRGESFCHPPSFSPGMETSSPRRAQPPGYFCVWKREILPRRVQGYDLSSLPSGQPGMGEHTQELDQGDRAGVTASTAGGHTRGQRAWRTSFAPKYPPSLGRSSHFPTSFQSPGINVRTVSNTDSTSQAGP